MMARKIEIVLEETADLSGCVAAQAADRDGVPVTPCRGSRWRMILQVTDRSARAFASLAPVQRVVPSTCDAHWFGAARYLIGEILASDTMREAAGIRPDPGRAS